MRAEYPEGLAAKAELEQTSGLAKKKKRKVPVPHLTPSPRALTYAERKDRRIQQAARGIDTERDSP